MGASVPKQSSPRMPVQAFHAEGEELGTKGGHWSGNNLRPFSAPVGSPPSDVLFLSRCHLQPWDQNCSPGPSCPFEEGGGRVLDE